MDAELQSQIAFHLAGKQPGADAAPGADACPALLARCRDLASLRYDYPVVLLRDASDKGYVQCLSGIVDDVVHALVKDDSGDRLTRHLLRLEQEVRALLASGRQGSLQALWDEAAGRLMARGDELLKDSLSRARRALKVRGELADCDAAMPAHLLKRAWSVVQDRKTEKLSDDIRRLSIGLANILQADNARSAAGRSASSLKAAIGSGHAEVFDFAALSRVLSKTSGRGGLTAGRRRRIESLLAVLRSQRFLAVPDDPEERAAQDRRYAFSFSSCAQALAAYRERLPEAMTLARSIAIAELEVEGQYNEEKHDALFKEFGESNLGMEELSHFPDYLVCVTADRLQAAETDKLMEMLSAGLPVKILVQTDDLLEESTIARDGHFALGMRAKQLASMAMGLNDVYVLQSAASNLFQFRERILKGMSYAGPALFSVFSGAAGASGALPPYLVGAAAMESRAFPAYTYDPSAGPNWASRFHLEANTQVEADWPVQAFTYEDEKHQRVCTELAFTFADFVACDPRHARHFAQVPHARWHASMVAADQHLRRDPKGPQDSVPFVLVVGKDNRLQRAIVDDALMRATLRCRESWHSLQELGGIHNSHAERRVAQERKALEEKAQQAAAAAAAAPQATPAAATAPAAAAAPVAAPAPEPEEKRSPDEAYIETARCTTCNECTQINDKMFAYNENKQAYIADPDAGTYAQLVEAAETCQVAIIHPGKPRNPAEPGLPELLKRAEAFA
ncbi:MAG: hypothetical protein WAO95_11535 [Burkholderiales bacterium]